MCIDEDKRSIKLLFADQELIFNGQASLYWPLKKLLIVADLHLEKGSYFAQRGNPLPLYDSLDTLKRLEQLIAFYKPQKILSLGDNIHDVHALKRMETVTVQLLQAILSQVDEWYWLVGNHDCDFLPHHFHPNLRFHNQMTFESITFCHDFSAHADFQIVGHYHPKVRVNRISGKCLTMNKHKIIMPSFGSYTGGLDIHSTAFKNMTAGEEFKAYMIHREKVWRIN